jgi:hypothetical protein
MPDVIYECLQNALAATGMTLPPIAPGTEVSPYLRSGARNPADTWDVLDFDYRGADGKLYTLAAYDLLTVRDGSKKVFMLLSGDDGHIKSHKKDLESGIESVWPEGAPPLNPGTTAPATDKIFRCLQIPVA